MTSKNSEIKTSVGLSVSRLIAAALSGLFWLYFADILSKNDYGFLGFLVSIATVGHGISLLGLNQVIIVYGAKNEDVLYPSYSLGLLSSVIVGIVSFLISENYLISILIVVLMIFTIQISYLNAKKSFSKYSIHFLLQRSLNLVLTIILFPFFGISGILLGLIFSNAGTFPNLYHFFKNKNFSLTFFRSKTKFMINNYIINLNLVLLWFGDKILIGTLFGMSSLAAYQISSQYLLFLNTIPLALTTYLLPNEAQKIQNSKLKLFSVIVSVIIAIISIILIPYLVSFFLPEYDESILIMQIMSVGIIFLIISSILESEFLGNEKSLPVLISTSAQIIFYFVLITLIYLIEADLFYIGVVFLISTITRTIFNFVYKKLQ